MNKFTKKIVLLSATVLLTSGTMIQSMVVLADSPNNIVTNSNDSNSSIVGENFINKFNGAIKLVGNKFVIENALLPKDTSATELKKLNDIISKNNSFLQTQLSNVNMENIVKANNSIVVGENHEVASSEASGVIIQSRTTYHEGSTYVHYYWWGMRIGVSKSMLRKIGSKGIHSSEAINAFAGALAIKRADAAAILGFVGSATWFLGTGLSKAPGGIVFNFTAGAPANGVWGLEWQ